jgi:hypothetical protein
VSGGTSKKEQLARQKKHAERAFVREERDQTILDAERGRHDKMLAKTAKLRDLRMAKEAGEREIEVDKKGTPKGRSAKPTA